MIRIEGLKKSFLTKNGVLHAVRGIDAEVSQGSFFTLVGPSGCGKSTTLRLLAGLERPDAGRIVNGDTVVVDTDRGVFVPTHKRKIGMVFQSYAIWPHMSVAANVGYPLKVSRTPRAEIKPLVEEALELVGLGGLGDRPAPRLSGGQQQRVALARALVGKPDVLLLDEPLSNLDAKLRVHMRVELKRLQAMLGLTTIYVTHDQQEALSMSDELAVMSHGDVMQRGAPADIYNRPLNRFTASFIGSANLVPVVGNLGRPRRGQNQVQTAIGPMVACFDTEAVRGSLLEVCIRPEWFDVTPAGATLPDQAENCFRGRVESWVFLGEGVDGEVRVGSELLRVKGTSEALVETPVGSEVDLHIPARHCRLIGHDPEDDTQGIEVQRVDAAAPTNESLAGRMQGAQPRSSSPQSPANGQLQLERNQQ